MNSTEFFSILDNVDSTNNYAMAKLHEGLAKHGMAWFAKEQTSGKGQRGKVWKSTPGENLILSILVEPPHSLISNPFLFNAIISLVCQEFISSNIKKEVTIKWPNDLFIDDRKAGGILIENNYLGKQWKWSVLGIGININQTEFDEHIKNPVSFKLITKKEYDPILLARSLHQEIIRTLSSVGKSDLSQIIKNYNLNLYKKEQKVKLRKGNVVFETMIKEVDENGDLHTIDNLPRQFQFGEIQWIL